MVAQRMANRPSISAALASSPAVKPFMIVGSTVIMMPSAATSSVTMRRMRISDRRSFIADAADLKDSGDNALSRMARVSTPADRRLYAAVSSDGRRLA